MSELQPVVVQPATPAFAAEPLIGEIDTDEPVDHYQVSADISKMTWNDQIIFARFQLLMETSQDTENTDRAVRIAALRDLIAGHEELTAFLNRVAIIKRNGQRIAFGQAPMDHAMEAIRVIGAARNARNAAKN